MLCVKCFATVLNILYLLNTQQQKNIMLLTQKFVIYCAIIFTFIFSSIKFSFLLFVIKHCFKRWKQSLKRIHNLLMKLLHLISYSYFNTQYLTQIFLCDNSTPNNSIAHLLQGVASRYFREKSAAFLYNATPSVLFINNINMNGVFLGCLHRIQSNYWNLKHLYKIYFCCQQRE